jgi:hypothetical protein
LIKEALGTNITALPRDHQRILYMNETEKKICKQMIKGEALEVNHLRFLST